jgi:putative flippase GtrA
MKDLIKIILKSDQTHFQLLRYTFVGGIAFVVDFSVLFILTEFCGIHYLISATISFILGLLTNYYLSIYFVFNNRRLKNKRVEFLVFALIGIVGLLINDVSIWFLTEVVSFHYLISKIGATIITYLWNFFVRKFSLFK